MIIVEVMKGVCSIVEAEINDFALSFFLTGVLKLAEGLLFFSIILL